MGRRARGEREAGDPGLAGERVERGATDVETRGSRGELVPFRVHALKNGFLRSFQTNWRRKRAAHRPTGVFPSSGLYDVHGTVRTSCVRTESVGPRRDVETEDEVGDSVKVGP